LADEIVYQRDFANRLQDAGFQTSLEVPVTATFKTFCKPYSLDLVVNNQIVYELKAVAKLSEGHVVAVTPEIRRRFSVSDANWQGTAFSGNFAPYLRQLKLLLGLSPLEKIHHINIDINKVTFSTVVRCWGSGVRGEEVKQKCLLTIASIAGRVLAGLGH